MSKKLITFVFGTRPELIKLAPLIKICEKSFRVRILSTGQHKELLQNLYDWFHITPDFNLEIMKPNQSPSQVISSILDKLDKLIEGSDFLIVQGDTATAFAAAMAGFLQKITVIHLEAGLRTDNRYNPFPEEMLRRQISRLATIHLAPTEKARENLTLEGVKDNVHVVGNTVIDSLKQTTARLKAIEKDQPKELEKLIKLPFVSEISGERIVLVTMHRRENLGKDHENVSKALNRIAKENENIKIVFPVHPNPSVRKSVEGCLKNLKNVFLIDPVDYVTFCWLLDNAHVLVTDSGGLQEEGTSLGKPTLVLRETTERPEAIEAGVAKLVGCNEEKVYKNLDTLLNNQEVYKQMSIPSNTFGNGHSSEKILEIID
ncbi:MAG: UDP-N-acetylglucosamine 2-epimerase (non-hydrolyzing) [Candidatus Caenarcaniphilales bacterium]|nr:UDP-N-acetylglucosamine 2-epimerase (non-hydrolyzing) [Candidatus Caenarcaniphilales bacterium]